MKKIFIILAGIYLIFLNSFYNSFNDETDWIQAGHLFKNAILSLNTRDTYIGYLSLHPGVTVLWISSIIQTVLPNLPYSQLVVIHRLVFLMMGFVLSLILANLLLRSFSKPVLIVMLFYIVLEPHSIISGNLSWLDFLLSFLILLCILIWIRFLNFGYKSDIIKAGILTGLAILTKFMGVYLFVAIAVLTIMHCKTNRITLKKGAKSLLIVFCVSLITFIILYPAMWTDPERVLLNRFNKQEANHQLTLAKSNLILKAFPQKFAYINPIIFLGILFLIIELSSVKKSINTPVMLGLSGIIYFLLLTITIFILFDQGRGPYAFLSAYDRYLLPIISLLGLFFFHKLFKDRIVNRFFKISLILFLFSWEIYRILYP